MLRLQPVAIRGRSLQPGRPREAPPMICRRCGGPLASLWLAPSVLRTVCLTCDDGTRAPEAGAASVVAKLERWYALPAPGETR